MHPAPSIIAFTTLSGLGFGLMAWLGAGAEPMASPARRRLSPPSPWPSPAPGLLASLLHLGQPRRFLKAFSQWRTSWLSREAVARRRHLRRLRASSPRSGSSLGIRTRWLGVPAAALALATVFAHRDDLRPDAQRPALAHAR